MRVQHPAGGPVPGNTLVAPLPATEEGARYALLQRLVPALHHQIMGNFQSIDMVAAMMERRLQPAAPDLASLREDCALLGSVSQTAVQSIVGLMGWVRPQPGSMLQFGSGVAECTEVLLNELQFRGFALVNQVARVDAVVSSGTLRSVLCAALIGLSDLSQVPASLVMRAQALPGRIQLSIDLIPAGKQARKAVLSSYRLLHWQDVEALAAAESVELARTGTGAGLVFASPAGIAGLAADPLGNEQG